MNNNPDRHKYFSENGAEMLQTVAIRTPKHLCIKDNSLIIREKGSSIVLGKIALSDIWVIIIDNPQVTMTSALISGINDAGIGVLYCGSDHMPNGLGFPASYRPGRFPAPRPAACLRTRYIPMSVLMTVERIFIGVMGKSSLHPRYGRMAMGDANCMMELTA